MKNCIGSLTAGIFAFDHTIFTDKLSTYDHNFGWGGGYINGQNSKITIIDCIFTNNFGKFGGLMSVSGNLDVEIYNIQSTNTTAFDDGGFMVVNDNGIYESHASIKFLDGGFI